MIDIFFKCEACGNHLVVDEARRSVAVECPDCHAPIVIPATLNAQQCPRCGRRLMIAPGMKGALVHCSSCREAIRTPGASTDQAIGDSSAGIVCPQCHAIVRVPEETLNRPTPCPSCGGQVYFRDPLGLKGRPNAEPPKPKDNDPLRYRRRSH
jgi:DNA-directed RNA polymerase subunit M/transcription elongation factor TFIIS